ncbi:MAG: hypothetical protein IAF38_22460 [Bacteroidia bacterium]|nr:hypothetical protein [Bacteroidia bacterium]
MNYEIMVGVEKNDSVKKNRIRFNLGWQLNTLNYSGKFKYEPWDKNYLLLKSKLRQHYLVFNLGYEFYFSRLKKPFSLEPFVNFNFFLKETLTQEVKDIAGSYDVFARGGLGSSNFDYVTVGAKINLNLLESRKLILGGGFFLSHNTNVVRIYYYPRDCNFYSIGLNLLVTIKTKKHEKKH